MKDIQILLDLYKEQRDLGMHHEEQRSTLSNLMLTAATALIGLIALDQEITRGDIPIALLVILLGIFGAFFSLKHYERFCFHRDRSHTIRLAIDAALRWQECITTRIVVLEMRSEKH